MNFRFIEVAGVGSARILVRWVRHGHRPRRRLHGCVLSRKWRRWRKRPCMSRCCEHSVCDCRLPNAALHWTVWIIAPRRQDRCGSMQWPSWRHFFAQRWCPCWVPRRYARCRHVTEAPDPASQLVPAVSARSCAQSSDPRESAIQRCRYRRCNARRVSLPHHPLWRSPRDQSPRTISRAD